MFKYFLTVFLVLVLQIPVAFASAKGPDIKVGLVVKQYSTELTSAGGILVTSGGKNITLKGNGKHFLSVKKGTLQIDNKDLKGNVAYVKTLNAKQPLLVNHKNYRGSISIRLNKDKKTLTVVNTLPIEDYLYGVVAKEIIPLWPTEAIKAQAVAARSFALAEKEKGNYEGYDIRANDMGQVYGGISAEHANTNKIVDATRGVVALYSGKPIEAFFHSSSGGYTESAVNVWGSDVPYLKAVKDFDKDSPKYNWSKEFTILDLEKKLTQAGYAIGKLQSIRVSPLKPAPMKANDRGISGRVKKITFRGDKASAVLDGAKVRSVLQLDSSLFEVYVGLTRPKHIDVAITDPYGNEIGKKRIPIKAGKDDTSGSFSGITDVRMISGVEGEKILFNGKGWGHGLGLSQWGARGMALSAPKGAKDYYKTILEHYYKGIDVKKIY